MSSSASRRDRWVGAAGTVEVVPLQNRGKETVARKVSTQNTTSATASYAAKTAPRNSRSVTAPSQCLYSELARMWGPPLCENAVSVHCSCARYSTACRGGGEGRGENRSKASYKPSTTHTHTHLLRRMLGSSLIGEAPSDIMDRLPIPF